MTPCLSLLTLRSLPCFADDLALAFLQIGGDGIHQALRVIDREIRQLHRHGQLVLLVEARRDFDVGHVVEAHLAFLHGALVEDFRRDRLGREVDALLLRLVQHGGEQAHLELEGQHVHARGPALAAFRDDFLDEQPPHRQVDRADDDEPPAVLAVEEARVRQRLGAVGLQDQVAEFLLPCGPAPAPSFCR